MLTIIIPVFNEIKTIEEIINLTNEINFIDTRFILVDDGSKGKNIKTQNNMFVGSTKDLLQALKGEQAKTIEGEVAEDNGET